MKTILFTALAALAVFGSMSATLRAASYNEAKITRLEKDVKVLKENAAPHAAAVGENVTAVTSVATGPSSRAELMFPDKSLTRLGANSRFTIRGQGHTIDLDKGVLLLQVPEKLRDAKVRTAAVTAAVTGGTLVSEYMPPTRVYPLGFIKIMVIEGIVDLFMNKDPSVFITMNAGEMIIQPLNLSVFTATVRFDLKRWKETTKLFEDGDPNSDQFQQALSKQQDQINEGDLVKTNLIIPGLGTVVQLTNDARLNAFNNFGLRDGTPGGPQGGPQGGGQQGTGPGGHTGGISTIDGPQFQGVIPLIKDLTVINAHSFIKTDPQVTAFNLATGALLLSDGSVYRPAFDGPFPYFGFGKLQIIDSDLQHRLAEKDQWAAYKFEKLLINGTPLFDLAPVDEEYYSFSSIIPIPIPNTIPNVILSALGDLTLAADNQFSTGEGSPGENTDASLDTSGVTLESLLLYSQDGSITLAEGFSIVAADQDISIVAAGQASDITLEGDINIYNGTLLVSAGRDLLVDSNVTADDITFRAGNDVTINGTGEGGYEFYTVEATNGNLLVSAKRNIRITDSAQLKALSELSAETLLRLESLEGNIAIDGNSTISGTNVEIEAFKGNISVIESTLTATHALKMRTLGPNGELYIRDSVLNGGNSASPADLIRLYAEGSNGTIRFAGTVTLNSDEVQIAARRVQVDPGGNVNITHPYGGNAHIFADQHNYKPNGVGAGSFGNINVGPYGNLQQYNYNAKPDFKTGGKLGRPSS